MNKEELYEDYTRWTNTVAKTLADERIKENPDTNKLVVYTNLYSHLKNRERNKYNHFADNFMVKTIREYFRDNSIHPHLKELIEIMNLKEPYYCDKELSDKFPSIKLKSNE